MEFLNHPDQPMEAKTIYDACSNEEFAERIQQERFIRKYHVTEAMSEGELRYGPTFETTAAYRQLEAELNALNGADSD